MLERLFREWHPILSGARAKGTCASREANGEKGLNRQAREAAAELSGRWLYAAMKEAGITQAELAKRSGAAPSHISQYVNSRRPCNLPVLLALLAACGLENFELRCTKTGDSTVTHILL